MDVTSSNLFLGLTDLLVKFNFIIIDTTNSNFFSELNNTLATSNNILANFNVMDTVAAATTTSNFFLNPTDILDELNVMGTTSATNTTDDNFFPSLNTISLRGFSRLVREDDQLTIAFFIKDYFCLFYQCD